MLSVSKLSTYDLYEVLIAHGNWRRNEPNGMKACLIGMDLRGHDLSDIDMSDVDFSGSDLSGVDLSGASLRNCLLVGTKLVGANLVGADLGLAWIRFADFTDTVFEGFNDGGIRVPDL